MLRLNCQKYNHWLLISVLGHRKTSKGTPNSKWDDHRYCELRQRKTKIKLEAKLHLKEYHELYLHKKCHPWSDIRYDLIFATSQWLTSWVFSPNKTINEEIRNTKTNCCNWKSKFIKNIVEYPQDWLPGGQYWGGQFWVRNSGSVIRIAHLNYNTNICVLSFFNMTLECVLWLCSMSFNAKFKKRKFSDLVWYL